MSIVQSQELETIARLDATDFATTLYQIALLRDPSSGEVTTILDDIYLNERTRKDIIKDVFMGTEFSDRALSDEDFVATAYRTILGRTASAEESASAAEELSTQANALKGAVDGLRQLVQGGQPEPASDPLGQVVGNPVPRRETLEVSGPPAKATAPRNGRPMRPIAAERSEPVGEFTF